MIVKEKLTSDSERSEKVKKNILFTLLVKGFSILINLALLPLTIGYLSPTKYGVWLTISSVLGWINFFDIGLGHGLRNKLTETLAKNDLVKAKAFVSTAYVSIGLVCLFLFICFATANYFINWNSFLNAPADMDEDFSKIALLMFFMFAIQFVLQLINSIFLGTQQPAKVSFFNMLSNLLVLIGIYILIHSTSESLLKVAVLFATIPVVMLLVINFVYFRTQFKDFSPSLKCFEKETLKEVMNLGIKFFIIQVSTLVFFQTSNILISQYMDPKYVTPYNVAFRYFSVISMVFNMVTSPYWSAYTDAYVKHDYVWIKRSIRQTFILWIFLVVASIIMLVCSEFVYKLWVKDVKVDFNISLFMMLYIISSAFGNIYITFLNGIGNIKLQMIINVIGMIVFIPLSHFLVVKLNLGTIGILIATIVCSGYGTLVAPFQVKRILQNSVIKQSA